MGDFTISMAFHRYSYKIGRVCVFIRASEYSYVNIRVFMCTAKGKKKKLASVMCAIGTVNRTSRDGSEPDRLDHCNATIVVDIAARSTLHKKRKPFCKDGTHHGMPSFGKQLLELWSLYNLGHRRVDRSTCLLPGLKSGKTHLELWAFVCKHDCSSFGMSGLWSILPPYMK